MANKPKQVCLQSALDAINKTNIHSIYSRCLIHPYINFKKPKLLKS